MTDCKHEHNEEIGHYGQTLNSASQKTHNINKYKAPNYKLQSIYILQEQLFLYLFYTHYDSNPIYY